ncbi:MAG: carbohydrate kinase family protein [Acetobacteraceae bacterium]
MSHDVSVIGLYILDVLGRPVTRIPAGGNVEFIDEIRLTVAGTAGGTVVDCAKLGLACLAVGAVGEDEKADFVLDTLRRHNVDISAMQRLPGVPTSATILNVRPNGERPALHLRGASGHFRLGDDDHDQALDAPIIHLGGTGLLDALDGGPSRRLLAEAKRRGLTTTFDLIAATAETLGLVRPLLPYVDYFMPSIEEACTMSGRADPGEIARFYRDLGAGTCIFTMGADGCYVASADAAFRLPSLDVAVTDTTGCGDAFSAGFICGLVHDFDLEASARLATAAAALVATGLGSDAGIVSFEGTMEALRTLKPRRLG